MIDVVCLWKYGGWHHFREMFLFVTPTVDEVDCMSSERLERSTVRVGNMVQ